MTTATRYCDIPWQQRKMEMVANFSCSLCLASAGEPCRTRTTGGVLPRPHLVRFDEHRADWERKHREPVAQLIIRQGPSGESRQRANNDHSSAGDSLEQVLSGGFSSSVLKASVATRVRQFMVHMTPENLSLRELLQLLTTLEQAAERIVAESRPACSVVSIAGTNRK